VDDETDVPGLDEASRYCQTRHHYSHVKAHDLKCINRDILGSYDISQPLLAQNLEGVLRKWKHHSVGL
jgi:hypothetical protein